MSVKIIFLTVYTEENRREKFVKMTGSEEHQAGRWGGRRGVDGIFSPYFVVMEHILLVTMESRSEAAGQKLTQLELNFFMKRANLKVFLTWNCIFITRAYVQRRASKSSEN